MRLGNGRRRDSADCPGKGWSPAIRRLADNRVRECWQSDPGLGQSAHQFFALAQPDRVEGGKVVQQLFAVERSEMPAGNQVPAYPPSRRAPARWQNSRARPVKTIDRPVIKG